MRFCFESEPRAASHDFGVVRQLEVTILTIVYSAFDKIHFQKVPTLSPALAHSSRRRPPSTRASPSRRSSRRSRPRR